MDAMYSVVRFFVTGGAFMYPILVVFAVGTAIAVERYLTLRRIRSKNEATWNRLQPTLAEGRFDDIAPCVACGLGCIGEQMKMRSMSCVINPSVGREKELTLVPAARRKTVADEVHVRHLPLIILSCLPNFCKCNCINL